MLDQTQIMARIKQLSHAQSVQTPVPRTNCIHWIVAHIVVARINFMRPLDIAPIWEWSICEHFIPGSSPTAATADQIRFSELLTDLERTQDQLLAALARLTESDLNFKSDGQTVAEQLVTYATHEAYHAGQLEVLRVGLGK